jgi:hypothetical protein
MSRPAAFRWQPRPTTVRRSAYFRGAYDPTRDGTRILAIAPDRDAYQVLVSPNRITELRRRVAESGGRR